jgi:hypothetical protein
MVQNLTDRLHYQVCVPAFSPTHHRFDQIAETLDGNNFGIVLPEFHTFDGLSVFHAIARHTRKSAIAGIAHADRVHNSSFPKGIFPSSTLFL